jgi:hypothetical protein
MSDADDTDEGGALRETYRSLGTAYRARPDAEMNAVGWTLFLGLVALLLPLLPILVVVWLLSKLVDAVVRRGQDRRRGS